MSNAAFGQLEAWAAVSRAKDAIRNWEIAVEKAKVEGTPEEIAFCERSLQACKEQLPLVKEAAARYWEW